MAELSTALSKFLRGAQAKWKDDAARAKESAFSNVDDGRYIGRLMDAKFVETNGSGNPMVTFNFVVVEGDNTGDKINKFSVFKGGEDDFVWFGRCMVTFGYDPEDIIWDPKKVNEDMHILRVLEDLSEQKPVCKLVLKTRNDYQGVTVETVLDDYDLSELPEVAQTKDDKSDKKTTTTSSRSTGKSSTKDDDEEVEETEEDEEVVDEEVELKAGMRVQFKWKDEQLVGVVKEIDEENSKVKVKVGNKVYPCDPEKHSLEIVDGEVDK